MVPVQVFLGQHEKICVGPHEIMFYVPLIRHLQQMVVYTNFQKSSRQKSLSNIKIYRKNFYSVVIFIYVCYFFKYN